jgi:hypothetical protein
LKKSSNESQNLKGAHRKQKFNKYSSNKLCSLNDNDTFPLLTSLDYSKNKNKIIL